MNPLACKVRCSEKSACGRIEAKCLCQSPKLAQFCRERGCRSHPLMEFRTPGAADQSDTRSSQRSEPAVGCRLPAVRRQERVRFALLKLLEMLCAAACVSLKSRSEAALIKRKLITRLICSFNITVLKMQTINAFSKLRRRKEY